MAVGWLAGQKPRSRSHGDRLPCPDGGKYPAALVIAVPDRPHADARVRPPASSVPPTAGAALAIPVMPVPAAGASLAGAMKTVNPDDAIVHAVGEWAEVGRCGAGHRSRDGQNGRCTRSLERLDHILLPERFRRGMPILWAHTPQRQRSSLQHSSCAKAGRSQVSDFIAAGSAATRCCLRTSVRARGSVTGSEHCGPMHA